jgi:uncharacterized protein YjiS (DUF1127 family)
MRHETFETGSIDIRSLNTAQRTALKLRLIREAHGARARAMQQAVARAFRSPHWLQPAIAIRVIRRAIDKTRTAYVRRRDRLDGLAELRAMADHELRDIGLSRSDIRGAAWFGDRSGHQR